MAEHALLHQAATELADLASALPRVYRHGDYSPRNWLWNPAQSRHGLIDFEDAAYGAAIEDFVWLHGALWPTRPDLKRAFLTGYDRALTPEEHQALHLITARVAASYLTTGIMTNNSVLTTRGHTALQHLLADDEQPQ